MEVSKELAKQAFSFNKVLDLLIDKLTGWLEQAILILPNLLVALLVIAVGLVISSLVGKLLEKIFERSLKNKALAAFLLTLSKAFVAFIAVILAISILHLDKTLTSLLAGLGIIGVSLGFAFQDLATNFISGIAMVIKTRYPFQVNDLIETNGYTGSVEAIDLRATTIRTFQGQTVLIPNKLIFENPLTNFSFLGERRVDVPVGISYGDDLQKVLEVTKAAVEAIDERIKSREVEFYYQEFGDSSINFELRFWVRFQNEAQFLKAQHQAVMAVKKAFDENDITIPFPIRTLDFGIKGGSTLAEMQTHPSSC